MQGMRRRPPVGTKFQSDCTRWQGRPEASSGPLSMRKMFAKCALRNSGENNVHVRASKVREFVLCVCLCARACICMECRASMCVCVRECECDALARACACVRVRVLL